MEQLADSLISVLKESPDLAIWVLAIIYGFKVAVVGSIYGTIRHTVNKISDVLMQPKRKVVNVDVNATLQGMTIEDAHEQLIAQISRISRQGRYIHASDVTWLKAAIDAHEGASPKR